MRAIGVFLLALTVCGCGAEAEPRPFNGPVRIEAKPVPMDRKDATDTRRGDFSYAGGLELRSPDTTRLGGLSDLKIDSQGHLIAESDEGDLLSARLRLDDAGHLAGLDDASIQPLKGADGRPLQGKAQADAEGLAVWPNGDLMVSFERNHRIWLYPAKGGPPRAVPKPDIAMPDNAGMEGLTLAPSRGPDAYWVGVEGGSIWLCRLSGGCIQDKGQVRPPFGYRLTALAETRSGDLVVLHHGLDPIRGSRVIVWITRPVNGGQAKVLAKLPLAAPMTLDNFEGVETVDLPNGAVRLFLISDDNFSASQRTLLMAFDWTERRKAGE